MIGGNADKGDGLPVSLKEVVSTASRWRQPYPRLKVAATQKKKSMTESERNLRELWHPAVQKAKSYASQKKLLREFQRYQRQQLYALYTSDPQEIIVWFGDALIEKTEVRIWGPAILSQLDPQKVRKSVDDLLGQYTFDVYTLSSPFSSLKLESKPSIIASVAKLVRQNSREITKYFQVNALSSKPLSSFDTDPGRRQRLSKQLLLLLKKSMPIGGEARDVGACLHIGRHEDDNDDEQATLSLIRDLISIEPFHRLTTGIRRTLYYNERNMLQYIDSYVRQKLSGPSTICRNCRRSLGWMSQSCCDNPLRRNSLSATFALEWNPIMFLKSHFDTLPRIGTLLTLSGSAFYTYGITCLDYMRLNWPESGPFILSSVQKAIDNELLNIPQDNVYIIQKAHSFDLKLKINFTERQTLIVQATGEPDMLVQLAQQLCWVSSAINIPDSGTDSVVYNKSVITIQESNFLLNDPTFKICSKFEDLHSSETPCWIPLFSHATIAYGFPIPPRENGIGLEIPVDILAEVAGARHAVEFEGGLVIKGFSSMCVPIKRTEDRVQWHLISSKSPETRLSYNDGLAQCRERALLDEVPLDSLRTTRAILGWWSTAETLLGKDKSIINYENIDYSGAEDEAISLKATGATFGFQQIGLAQVDIALGPKDGKCHFHRQGPYRNIILSAEKTPIALFDTGERRAWLVPASEVMLHIAQHRNWLMPFTVNNEQIQIPSGKSAREVLLSYASTDLVDGEEFKFKDLIIQIWSLLEFLLDKNVSLNQKRGHAIRNPLKDVIHGFEFKAVVEERSPFTRKQFTVRMKNGGWPGLIRDIDALVLLANGFEDLIKPVESERICHSWARLPKGKDYLATTVKIVKDLYDVAGCRLNRQYLTSTKLQWHRGNSALFEACTHPKVYHCDCIRAQQVVTKAFVGKVIPPGQLENQGIVIFGDPDSMLRHLSTPKGLIDRDSLYSQPNIPLITPIMSLESEESQTSVSSELTLTPNISSPLSYAEGKGENKCNDQLHLGKRAREIDTIDDLKQYVVKSLKRVSVPVRRREIRLQGTSHEEGLTGDHPIITAALGNYTSIKK